MVKYRTYCKKAPKNKVRIKKLKGSQFTKPVGGLWGCRGDEWIDWCRQEEFCLDKWKECFEWELTKDAKVLRVRSVSGFTNLIKKYYKNVAPGLGEVDFLQIAKEYDAIELTEVPVTNLHFGYRTFQVPIEDFFSDRGKMVLYKFGTYSWDVPSICVFNADKIKVIRSWKVK